MVENKNEEKYEKARKRVEEIKGFYSHLITFGVVITALIIINLVTQINDSDRFYWFLFPLGFWGFGLFWHAMSVFVFSKKGPASWENRKIKEVMKQMDEEDN